MTQVSRFLRRLAIVSVVVVVLDAPARVVAQPQPPDTSADAVVAAARAYLQQYRTDLIPVIAIERSTQRIRRQVPIVPDGTRTRTTISDVHFRFVESDDAWMAIRDVRSVDGKALEGRPDLAAALTHQEAGRVGRTFKDYNSQFNIGRLVRNFNEPTLVLGVLAPARADAFRFERKGVRTERGVVLVTVSYKEVPGAQPFAYDLLMRPAPVRGEVVIEAGTGRIRKASIELVLGSVKALLTTTFERNEKLDLWLPAVFTEYYEDGVEPRGAPAVAQTQYESIFCESTYTDFKRFMTAARIR